MTTIAIIGAGLSGLTAAHFLKGHAGITLFEKSRGFGGRLATRRAEPYAFDHGAQYFTVRSDAFRTFVAPMISDGVIERWDARYVEFENSKIIRQSQWDATDPHYVGVPGMNAVGKFLGQSLNVHRGVRVQSMQRTAGKWQLEDDQGNGLGTYDWVISAVPSTQASDLLPASLPFHAQIRAVKMRGCLSLMLGFEKPLPLEFDAARVHGADISWIAVNSSKPGRSAAFSLLVHSTNAWADDHLDDDRERVMHDLCTQASALTGHDLSDATYQAVHGWRYANVAQQTGATHLIDRDHAIAVCGDWRVEGRVEAAFESGFDAANSLLDILNSGTQNA